MPVVEAMNLGTPVITSNLSSLPEAAGDAALLVDPYNTEDISYAMERVFSDSALRAQMIEKGYAQAKKFSWEKTARDYIRVLEDVVS
jgi:glycosyltransferase involved in cell wall biosynthesis